MYVVLSELQKQVKVSGKDRSKVHNPDAPPMKGSFLYFVLCNLIEHSSSSCLDSSMQEVQQHTESERELLPCGSQECSIQFA